jgi:hypothetical protein
MISKNIKMKYLILLITLLISGLSFSQKVNIDFKNISDTSYTISDIRKITFQNDTINLVLTDGTIFQFRVKDISNVNFNLETAIINEVNQISIEVFPNPATNFLTIVSKEAVEVEIIDLLGRTRFKTELIIGKNIIDIDNLESGEYIITMSINNSKISKKIIKL